MKVTSHLPRELTAEQVEEAQYLANIVPQSQRPPITAQEEMSKRQSPSANTAFVSSLLTVPPIPEAHMILPSVPVVSQSPNISDWEIQALKGIRRNKLSLDKVWTMKTWNMKSNISQRLKLLDDDGYDIKPLLIKGTTSAQVTQAVLDHIEDRKQQIAVVTASDPKQDVENDATQLVKNHEHFHHARHLEDGSLETVESEPLPERRPHVTEPMTPQKRKHQHDYDEQTRDDPEGTGTDKTSIPPPCTCGPARKRPRMSTPAESEKAIQKEAWNLFKNKVARDIFQSSRAACKEAVPNRLSIVDPVSAPLPAFLPKPPVPSSRIIFTSTDPSSNTRTPSDVRIGSRGLAFMMDEVKFLSHTQDEQGRLYICDPEAAEDREGDQNTVRLMEYKPTNSTGDYSPIDGEYRGRIRVSEDLYGQVIMHGDAFALQGLIKQLRNNDLNHISKWRFDGKEVVREDSMSWSLSSDTQDVLAKIEKILEAGQDRGGVVVRVEQVYNGKKLRYS
ncbi:uncharacterized protein K460DRAFT_406617 [Cucurbitaria berberidis CBS 394.84]|uniref:Uncharacterized protein n=1 Tax=Cucurbitaria berberidis CBS 394.84 TaxID=1168544 RepID=A0A9P4L9P0_9PLEO|nr:uncharacterized protein K460DRAFT_406617 [Cucurbitaria berberidis CBS 394.84]KAF1846409.1 hypothetical protein K460DRAFT_406617 [Cucurbitaria berberidis CBS 394.84]